MLLFYSALNTIEDLTEREKIEKVYDMYSTYVIGLIKFFDKNKHDADDLLQDVFLRVIRYRNYFIDQNEIVIKHNLFLHTRWVCLDANKKSNNSLLTQYCIDEDGKKYGCEIPDETSIFDQLFNEQAADPLATLIKQLPFPQKDIIELKFFSNMRNKEIASMLSIPYNTVGTILHRTLKKLKRDLESVYNDK